MNDVALNFIIFFGGGFVLQCLLCYIVFRFYRGFYGSTVSFTSRKWHEAEDEHNERRNKRNSIWN